MSITQISKITHRKGLTEDLPQLDIGELGWAYDQRRLFIGNAPAPHHKAHPDFPGSETTVALNVTEILTNESNILELANGYQYQGAAAGYEHETVRRSLIAKLDERVSVKDYGAVGDGTTDDTGAIQLAITDLYTRTTDLAARRILFFPAGIYTITNAITIPSNAYLAGEGRENSLIVYEDTSVQLDYVWHSAPEGSSNVVLQDLGLETRADVPLMNLENAYRVRLDNVGFTGSQVPGLSAPETNSNLLLFASEFGTDSTIAVSEHIIVSRCSFNNADKAVIIGSGVRHISFNNCEFSNIRSGIDGTAVKYIRVASCSFNNVTTYGVKLDAQSSFNTTHFNFFSNVANGISEPVISFAGPNNFAIGDVFERSAPAGPNINLFNKPSIAFENAERQRMGTYVRETGKHIVLLFGTTNGTVFTVPAIQYRAFKIDFTIQRPVPGSIAYRTGSITISVGPGNGISWDEDYTEHASPGVEFTVVSDGTSIRLKYSVLSNSLGSNATLTYSVTKLL